MLVQNLALATQSEMYHETLLTCIAMLVGGNSDVSFRHEWPPIHQALSILFFAAGPESLFEGNEEAE